MHCQWGRKPPKLPRSPWDFVTLPKEHRATVMGNMQKNLVKIARVVAEMSSRTDRQTDTHTYMDTLITILCNRGRRRSNTDDDDDNMNTTVP